MITLFRTSLLLTFALFWGGLTFYTGIAVRIAHDVLADPMEGGLITQRVTNVLQWLGTITAALMLVNAFLVGRTAPKKGIALLVLASTLSLSLVGLFIVHSQLDAVISIDAAEITDRDAFTIGHRRYNQLTTVEWLASLFYLPVTLFAWQQQANKPEQIPQ